MGREREPEFGTLLRPLRSPDPAAHRLDELTADEQPDSGTGRLPAGIGRAVEELEQILTVAVLDTDAGVEDTRHDLAILVGDRHPDIRAHRAVFRRVGEQVAG